MQLSHASIRFGISLLACAAGCGASLARNPDGAAGASGSSGSSGGGGTGGVGGLPTCSAPTTPDYPTLQWFTGEGALFDAYDGPVIVAANSPGMLTLTTPPGSGDGGAGAGGGDAGGGGSDAATTSGRLVIGSSSTNPLPSFPVGAQVWLTKTQGPSQFLFEPPTPPAAFAVRDRHDGTLLFGGNENALDATPAHHTLPVETGAVTAVCTGPSSISCAPMNTYYSTVFVGDTLVVLRNGERGEIKLAGVAYDVWVKAWEEAFGCLGDAWAGDGFKYDIRAKNLADLIAGLAL
jgi:hypothetical protein